MVLNFCTKEITCRASLGEEADILFDDGAVEVKVLHGVKTGLFLTISAVLILS